MRSGNLFALLFCSIILTILSVVFFIMFCICYGHHDQFSKTVQYSTDKKKWPPYVKGIIAMEFFMFICGIMQLVFFICAFKCINHVLFSILAVVFAILFFVCWIISILIFRFSPENDFIKSIDAIQPDSDIKLYSWDSFKEQMTIWSHRRPSLYIEVVGISNDKVCSDFINITTVRNIHNSVELDPINFNDISGDSLVMVDIQVEIKYDSENKKKLDGLQKDIKKCADAKGVTSTVSKIEGLDGIPDAVLITKNGEIPTKLKKNLAMARAVFGLGFDVITDILSFPIYERKIKISETTFDYSFDCSKLKYRCFQISDDTTLNQNKKQDLNLSYWSKMKKFLNEHIISTLKRKMPKSYNQGRFSRSFYLSKAAYTGNFGSYEGNGFNSGNLISVIKSCTENGKFRPVWYMGTHKKDLYVAIRGSASLNDFLTDAAYGVSTEIDLSFHRGFYYAAKYVWNEIEGTAKEYRNNGYTIVFTGHSYGGSVAQILHRFARASFGGGVCSYVFGAAASMGKNTASLIKNECYSFVYCNDIVPRLMNYVQGSKGLTAQIPLLKVITLDIDLSMMQRSRNWGTTGKEKITEPVGTIYHLPYRDDPKSNWGSISSTIINIKYNFYVYNLHSIKYATHDHDLGMYYAYSQYYDGIIMPWDM